MQLLPELVEQCICVSFTKKVMLKFVRFSFNSRHWLILFHQPIAISQSLGL